MAGVAWRQSRTPGSGFSSPLALLTVRTRVVLGAGCAALAAVSTAQASSTRPDLGTTAVPHADAHRPGVSTAPVDTTARQRFDIRAQPLPDALADFARQAGLRVTFDPAALRGAHSAPLAGTFTPPEALRRLLGSTGFRARFADLQTVTIAPAAASDRVAVLGRVVVTGAAPRPRGYGATYSTSATKTSTPLRDVPQAVSVVTRELIADQAMQGLTDVVRYVPGITMSQGEGHRDQPVIRGQNTTADLFVDGVRDDAQYYRDLYNVERVEALKGANAMIFGRGGGGGVINRVSKQAQWAPTRALTLQGGSFDQKRGTLDVGQGLGGAAAARLNGLYENSGTFRDGVRLRRYGINPTAALAAGSRTLVRFGYELFDDERTVDRGIPSVQGRPAPSARATFFGDPRASYATARVQAGDATLEHTAPGGLVVRNRTRLASYDKFYQNVYPDAVNAAAAQVRLSAYNNATARDNLFNQTDVTYGLSTGAARHTLLVGAELGRQGTSNRRETGYFNNTATTVSAPVAQPTIGTPLTFRQGANDADNRTRARSGAVYAQDQVALSPQWQAVVGLRYERFGIDFRNNRDGQRLARRDAMLSPRAGLVFKPRERASLYGTYSVSYLPSAGDQFSSLTATSQTLAPERFRNYEVGAKWDVRPDFAVTTAAYRLDRTNTTAPDPVDARRVVQTGSQRTTGVELGVTGRVTSAWEVAGGYAAQRARITSTTTAARAGARVPLVPAYTLSLWNKVRVAPALGVGLGVVRQASIYAATDNTLTLPAFTRLDGAVFVNLPRGVRAQANLENLLNQAYFPTAYNNYNITPGAPRTVRLSLATGF